MKNLINEKNFNSVIFTLKETKEFTNEVSNFYKQRNESKIIDNENLRIKNDIITQARKFQQTKYILENIFNERFVIINKHFEAIDKGLRNGDNELILRGLKSVSDFVAINPLGDYEKFKNILNGSNNETLNLDF